MPGAESISSRDRNFNNKSVDITYFISKTETFLTHQEPAVVVKLSPTYYWPIVT